MSPSALVLSHSPLQHQEREDEERGKWESTEVSIKMKNSFFPFSFLHYWAAIQSLLMFV